MNEMEELHPTRLEELLTRLKQDPKISPTNKEAILQFIDYCAAEGLTRSQQRKHLYSFFTIFKKFAPEAFELRNAPEDQIKEIMAAIYRSDYAEWTKVMFGQTLNKFYRIENDGIVPKKCRFIRTSPKRPKAVTREDLYTKEELEAIFRSTNNIRDLALFRTLYETGARPAEILLTRIGDVTFNEKGDFIFIHGVKNTPDRTIQLIEAGIVLREWIKRHPKGRNVHNPIDTSAPLWVKMEQNRCANCGVEPNMHERYGCNHYVPVEVERMKYAAAVRAFKQACKRAGVNKRNNKLYNLRHTRITEACMFMSHEQLCKFAGWAPGSDRVRVYSHLISEDVNQAIRKHYNIGTEKEQEFITCPICGQRNPPGSLECRNCKRPLSLESKAKLDQLSEAVKLIAELQEEGKLEGLLKLVKSVPI